MCVRARQDSQQPGPPPLFSFFLFFFEYLSSVFLFFVVRDYYWGTFLDKIAISNNCYNFHCLSFGTLNKKSKNEYVQEKLFEGSNKSDSLVKQYDLQ